MNKDNYLLCPVDGPDDDTDEPDPNEVAEHDPEFSDEEDDEDDEEDPDEIANRDAE